MTGNHPSQAKNCIWNTSAIYSGRERKHLRFSRTALVMTDPWFGLTEKTSSRSACLSSDTARIPSLAHKQVIIVVAKRRVEIIVQSAWNCVILEMSGIPSSCSDMDPKKYPQTLPIAMNILYQEATCTCCCFGHDSKSIVRMPPCSGWSETLRA